MFIVILGEFTFLENFNGLDFATVNNITGVAKFPTEEQASEFGEASLENAEGYLLPSVYSKHGNIEFNCDVTLVENVMGKKLWVYDSGNARVVTTDDDNVFYCDNLTCSDDVINRIVTLYNSSVTDDFIGSEGIIDLHLLDEGECTQEDREEIVEQIYTFLYPND